MEYSAIIKHDDELVDSLCIASKEAIEFSKEDAITSAGKGFKEEIIAV